VRSIARRAGLLRASMKEAKEPQTHCGLDSRSRESPAIAAEAVSMRKILQLMYPPAFAGIAVFFLLSCINCLNAPFLGAPAEEAHFGLILCCSRVLAPKQA